MTETKFFADKYFSLTSGLNIRDWRGEIICKIVGNSLSEIHTKTNVMLGILNEWHKPKKSKP